MTQSQSQSVADSIVTIDRRKTDRRGSGSGAASEVKPQGTPRRKQQRRRQIDPTTCERDYNNDEIEFMRAMDAYKRAAGRMFPTCSEVLEVVRSLGYVKLTEEQRDHLQLDAPALSGAEPAAADEDEDEEAFALADESC